MQILLASPHEKMLDLMRSSVLTTASDQGAVKLLCLEGIEEAPKLLAKNPAARLCILYLPPWSLTQAANAELAVQEPAEWLGFYAGALKLRRAYPARVQLVSIGPANLEEEFISLTCIGVLDDARKSTLLEILATTSPELHQQRFTPLLETIFRKYFPEVCAVHEQIALMVGNRAVTANECSDEQTEASEDTAKEAQKGLNCLADLIDLLNRPVPQVIEEFEKEEIRLAAQLAERTKALEEQGQRLKAQKKQLEDQQQKLEEQMQQLESMRNEKESLERKSASAEEENELLLMQLHQVQEELESYYLRYKDVQQELKNSTALLAQGRQFLLTAAHH